MSSTESTPSPPLVTHIYTADPSAHNFNGHLYIYPSHDRETDIKFNDNGDQYDMADYHVFSLESLDPTTTTATTTSSPDRRPEVVDHGVVLRLEDVPWASKQLWAPDAARNPRDGRYHLFFPARDGGGVFRIGVAVADRPEGPFAPEDGYIPGTYSIDPAVLVDDDDARSAYLYFGGLWGGQLQCYQQGGGSGGADPVFDEAWSGPREPSGEGVYALGPRVARLAGDMKTLAAPSPSSSSSSSSSGGEEEGNGVVGCRLLPRVCLGRLAARLVLWSLSGDSMGPGRRRGRGCLVADSVAV